MDQDNLKEKLLQCELFACLSDEELSTVLKEGEVSYLKKGDYLHKQGETSNFVSYILDGKLEVFIHDAKNRAKQLATIEKHNIVGESAIFFRGKRVANVKTLSDSVVVNISDSLVRELLKTNSNFKQELKKTSLDRMIENFGTIYFKSYFPETSDSLIKVLVQNMKLKDINKGEVLYKKGDQNDSIYFLVRGRLKSFLFDQAVQAYRDVYFTPGETIGQIAAFSKKERKITVGATRNSFVLELSIEALNKIKEDHPDITDIFLKVMVEKEEKVQNEYQYFLKPKTIAIVPLHESVSTDEFLRKLSQSIKDKKSTSKVADLEFVNERLNIEDFQNISNADPQYFHLNAMFSTLEKDHDFCFYLVDENFNTWSKYCLDNADEIILLADSTKSPELTPFERKYLSFSQNEGTPIRLILIHPNELVEPRNTSKWLESRQVIMHHHIKEAFVENDISRIFRFISNQAIGVVLSGGGARGNAHIGVCDALTKHKIPFDYIGGTSHGSLIGAMYIVSRFKRDVFDSSFRELLKGFVFDYTLPLVSLVSAKALERSLKATFGDIQIEDLWTPFFCVSSNLSKNEPYFHKRGSLATAVRASCSIPGIFPPVILNGEVLVDGGLIFNLPILPMKEFIRGGIIIASLITGKEEDEFNKLPNLSLSGWRYLWNKFKPFSKNSELSVPNIGSILYRSGTVSSTYEQNTHEKHSDADLIIKPPVSHFERLDYDQVDEIRVIGYQATVDALSGLKKNILKQLITNWVDIHK